MRNRRASTREREDAGTRHGLRLKGEEEVEAEGGVKGGALALGSQAPFGWLVAKDLEGHLPQDRQILRGGAVFAGCC